LTIFLSDKTRDVHQLSWK